MKRFAIFILFCLSLAACGASAPSAPPSVVSTSGGTLETQLNALRAQANVPAVRRNAVLDAAALVHAKDMAARNFFSHTGSNGSSAAQRVTASGYRWCTVAENINKGYSGASANLVAWRNSPGHYRNLIKSNVREYGIADAGGYWVMVLAAQKC